MTIQTLPLFSLTLSSLNVRRTERDADVAALAEDIAACGLKQNLVVVPAHFSTAETEDNFGDKFEVIAGGRRYQALRLLADAGRIEHDFPVPVLVEQRAAAQQTSLSENLHRVAMNPADEFEAFAAIVDQQKGDGSSETEAVAYTAKRFGVTTRHVEGRLRLAALAPEILEALRAGKLGLESAKAYAGTADHDLQMKVFKARLKYGEHNPRYVRDELRQRTLPITSAMVTFVELEAYRAAGGRTETEMFMGTEGEERIIDVGLMEKMARERAEAMIPAQAKADGFASGLYAKGVGHYATCPTAPKGYTRLWGYGSELSKAKKKKAIAGYGIASDGLGLHHAFTFVPEEKRDEASSRDWEAERLAADRDRAILRRAARIAVGKFSGTPLDGRAFWPRYGTSPVEADREDDSFLLVTVQIRIPRAEVESRIAEATILVDEEAAAAAAQASVQSEETEEADA